jgi:hypothetical protein
MARYRAGASRDGDSGHLPPLSTINSSEYPEDPGAAAEFVARCRPFLNRSVISGT